jgi:hypothetical protein
MTVKRISFYAIALALPIILLCALEGTLRLLFDDQYEPLFIPVEQHSEYIQPNPKVIQRYFPSPELAPQVAPDTHYFLAKKPLDTTRVVILGGSSAAGFPYGRFGSPSGFMQQRIHGLYPEQNIEFISVAMSSINSYMLRDFIPEILEIEPDAIYIYAGHNEYLGVMGVGSRFSGLGSHTLNLLYLSLKEWRLVQVIQALLMQFQLTDALDQVERSSRTVMASVAKNANIPYQSVVFEQGKQQFSDNLHAILGEFEEQKIPVFLSTIASNLAQQPPFSAPYILPEALQKELENAQKQRDITALQKFYHAHPYHPQTNFALGIALRQVNPVRAKQLLASARDYDSLRFRAPSVFNTIIEQQSQNYAHVHLVEGEKILAQASPFNIIDNTLMLEHLHPNTRGYFLLAESAIAKMQEVGLFQARSSSQKTNKTDINFVSTTEPISNHNDLSQDNFDNNTNKTTHARNNTYVDKGVLKRTQELTWQHAWVSEADNYVAHTKINRLLADYPFVSEPQVPISIPAQTRLQKIGQQRLKDGQWLAQQQAVLNHFMTEEDFLPAANAAASMATALPYSTELAWQTAQLYRAAKSLDYAHYFIRKAHSLTPKNPQIIMDYAHILFNKQLFKQALQLLKKVAKMQPNNTQIQQYIKQVQRTMENQS